jgi:uncharacterized protein (TIGR04141 family)
LQPKYLDNGDFVAEEMTLGGQACLLVAGAIENADIEWARVVSAYTGRSLGLINRTAAAVILLPRPKRTLALAYGMGWILLDQRKVERSFGLRYAVRALDPEEIRQVTRHILERRARIDRNSVPGGQRIEDFVIEEYGEIISRLVGRSAAAGLTFAETGRARFSMAGSDSLAIPLGRQADRLLSDLALIERVVDESVAAPELKFIEQLRSLKTSDARVPNLAHQLGRDVKNGEARLALAYPFERDEEHGEAQAYRLRNPGTDELIVEDLDLPTLHSYMGEVAEDGWLKTLGRLTVQALADESGDQVIGRAIPGNKWITAEVTLDDQQYFYRQARWYEVGEGYLDFLRGEVAAILSRASPIDLPNWRISEEEKDFNKRVGAEQGYVVLDRKLVRTKQHPRGIELCDLLGPDNELIHVKKADSSAPLSHLFAQGAVSCEALITDRDARARLREMVIQQRPNSPLPQRWRPHAVVYAMALNREISKQTLFTFTQVVLVRNVQLLDRMQVQTFIDQVDFDTPIEPGIGGTEEVIVSENS